VYLKLVEHWLLTAESQDSDAFHLALEHPADAVGELLSIAVGGADQDFVAIGDSDLFEAGDEFGKEGIGDVFNDDAKDAATSRNQAAGMGIRKVVELLDRLPDARRRRKKPWRGQPRFEYPVCWERWCGYLFGSRAYVTLFCLLRQQIENSSGICDVAIS